MAWSKLLVPDHSSVKKKERLVFEMMDSEMWEKKTLYILYQ